MDPQSIALAVALLIGLIIGAVVAWATLRSAQARTTEAAVAKVQSDLSAELGQLRERARLGDEGRQQDQRQLSEARSQLDQVRAELDRSRDDVARLGERAAQVPQLQQKLEQLDTDLKTAGQERSRVSEELARSSQQAASLSAQLRDLTGEAAGLRASLDECQAALSRAQATQATLEQQARRIDPLELEVAGLRRQLDASQAELTQLAGEKAGLEEQARRVQPLEQDGAGLRRQLDAIQAELQQAAGDKASLEEQARRIVPLTQEAAALRAQLDAVSSDLAALRESSGKSQGELGAALQAEREALALARQELDAERRARASAQADANRLTTELAEASVSLDAERKAAEEKLVLLQQAQGTLANQFQVLANQILEEKSQKFAEQNKTAIGALLEPLRNQITEFKGKVEEVYVQEGKDRTALAEQVRHLLTLNKTLSQDAQNLTDALKGNAQVQGAWGEWVLEEMLSSSGLMANEHYFLQDSRQREDGTRGRPDVLITLPGGRQLVVDSKVSLVAYEQYASAKNEEERSPALKAHLESVRRHVTGLSEREYQKLYPTLDFVMMFVPLEPAFMLMAVNDRQMFSQAWDRNVLIVSPSTLLFVLRTVAYLWRQEDQNRNAQAIADRGALLYDKFCDFLKDLESVGARLDQAQAAYGDARKKLTDGNGNLITQAKKLTSLGVKGSKKIPPALMQLSGVETEGAEDAGSDPAAG